MNLKYGSFYELILGTIHSVKYLFTDHPKIVHQGIQRSRTNYLRVLLKKAGFFVLNEVDVRRDHPNHKHFRWQDKKKQ